MNTWKSSNRVFHLAAVVLLSLLVSFSSTFAADKEQGEAIVLPLDGRAIDRDGPPPISYAPMLSKVTPAVVSVHTARVVRVYQGGGGLSPQEELLRRFFGVPMPRQQEGNQEPETREQRVPQGVGSGVIVRSDGYILTNNHVVTGEGDDVADEVLVRLHDGRELPAEVIGRDPKTDIAVIKIDATDLPVIPLADSEQIAVGDVVFAVGNPMGVGQTVTRGIVSATGRSIGIYGRDGYENFIQTDASINPGNSGGALLDVDGRLVGINSAILSRTGGNIGIGFAIPSNLAAAITTQLTAFGEVRRGFIGVQIADLTPDMAESFELDSTDGALVEKVSEDSPAEAAGLKAGDVIVSVDGRSVKNANHLRIRVAQLAPDTEVSINYYRDGKLEKSHIKVGDMEGAWASMDSQLLPGVSVELVTDDTRSTYGIPSQVSGLLIKSVSGDSPYARYLREGMVVLEINGRDVSDLESAQSLIVKGVNRLYVFDRGRVGFVALRVM